MRKVLTLLLVVCTILSLVALSYAEKDEGMIIKELTLSKESRTLHENTKTKIRLLLGDNSELDSELKLEFRISESQSDKVAIRGKGVLINGSTTYPFKGTGELTVSYIDGKPVYVGPLYAMTNNNDYPLSFGIHYYPSEDKLFVTLVINEIGDETVRLHFGEPFVEANMLVNDLKSLTKSKVSSSSLIEDNSVMSRSIDYVTQATQDNTYIKTKVGRSNYGVPTNGASYHVIADVYSKNSAVRSWWENNYNYPGATEVIDTVGENEANIEIDFSGSWACMQADAEPNDTSTSVSVPIFFPSYIQYVTVYISSVDKTVSDSTDTASWEFNSPNIGTNPAGGHFAPDSSNSGSSFSVSVDTDIKYTVYIDLYNDDWNPYTIIEYHYASNPTVSWTVN